ncbi:MAG: hypothetical protein JWO24_820 [Rhodospirillales bacterium]|nr:hypothetical protein [Rhodospirillales bacterium]
MVPIGVHLLLVLPKVASVTAMSSVICVSALWWILRPAQARPQAPNRWLDLLAAGLGGITGGITGGIVAFPLRGTHCLHRAKGLAEGAPARCNAAHVDSFNGKLRDELLNAEVFHTLAEARVLTDQCAATTTRSGRTPRWATARRRLRCSCR